MNIFKLGFYQDQSKWKHRRVPFEISKNDSDIGIDLLFCESHCVLTKELHIFLGNHSCNYVWRRCFSSYANQNFLKKHKQRSEQQEITSIRTSNESHLYWEKHFQKNPSFFRIIADFEADSEIDNSSI